MEIVICDVVFENTWVQSSVIHISSKICTYFDHQTRKQNLMELELLFPMNGLSVTYRALISNNINM